MTVKKANALRAFALAMIGVALGGCVVETGPGVGPPSITPPPSPGPNLDQTFGATFADGTRGQFVQRFASGAGRPGLARICFINNSGRPLTLVHQYPGVNPMAAAPGGRSCANFDSSRRVSFTLMDQSGAFPFPARTDKNLSYSLSPMNGGLLNLTFSYT